MSWLGWLALAIWVLVAFERGGRIRRLQRVNLLLLAEVQALKHERLASGKACRHVTESATSGNVLGFGCFRCDDCGALRRLGEQYASEQGPSLKGRK